MSRYTISQACPPTREELERWGREADYLRFRPPNPRAPRGSAEMVGWGVPPGYMPPPDAVEWVMSRFKREIAGVPQQDKLRPEFKFSILSVCIAHFMWLRTAEGASWLLAFFGIQELPPFYEAYAYFYIHHETKSPVQITNGSGLELKSWRRADVRDLNPPIKSGNDQLIYTMVEILKRARFSQAVEPIPESSGEMFFWVSEQIRDWFLETKPDKHWPTHNPARTVGFQWAKNLEKREGVLFYEVLSQIDTHGEVYYRLKDVQGGILWCGAYAEKRGGIKCAPLPDAYRYQKTLSEHQIVNMFQCSSCGNIRACLPVTADEKMCCHCYGSFVERDVRGTLDWCTMKECSACPDHISKQSDLINIKNRLNRDVQFPVRR